MDKFRLKGLDFVIIRAFVNLAKRVELDSVFVYLNVGGGYIPNII